MEKIYELIGWINFIEFLEFFVWKGGWLLRGGELDFDGVVKMVLNDFMRGKILWFILLLVLDVGDVGVVNGCKGKFGEMLFKCKVDEVEDIDVKDDDQLDEDEEEFEGFGSVIEEDVWFKNIFFMGEVIFEFDSEIVGEVILEVLVDENGVDDVEEVVEFILKREI